MSGGKNRAKNDLIFELRSARTCEKLFQNIDVFFCILSCQNIASTSVFGCFALGAGSREENTGICDTCYSQKTVFSTHSLKNTVKCK